MNIPEFLREVTVVPGLPGYEMEVAKLIAERFSALADEVYVDHMNNVIARLGSAGPKIFITAHLDEIGLCVRDIESDGSVRVTCSGGVDPRILPAAEVIIHARTGELFGVIGAKSPHLLTEADQKKSVQMKDTYIDLGMSADRVKALVRVGDMVTLVGPVTELADGYLSSKTMDDRASVAALIVALEQLKRMNLNAQVYFVAASQEEVGSNGAKVSGYALAPDASIAIDVTHGAGPGTDKWEAFPLDKPVIGKGPILSAVLTKRLMDVAKQNHIEYSTEISNGNTWTDADALHTLRDGIPTALISIPLRYMHTTVETLSASVVEEVGRLAARFVEDISLDWGDIEWF